MWWSREPLVLAGIRHKAVFSQSIQPGLFEVVGL
jgi:hypothetical protein